MRQRIIDISTILKHAFLSWKDKDPFRESAVIAYYAIFSIPGLMLLILTITGLFFKNSSVSESIVSQISATMGPETAAQIESMLNTTGKEESGLLKSILGIIVLLVGATGVFVELQKSLNQIWNVKRNEKSGILQILKTRLFSFGLIIAIAFLLLISLVVSTFLAATSDWIQIGASGFVLFLVTTFNILFSLTVISALFAMMFKYLPDVKLTWKQVWPGALLTGILFTIGKTAMAYYFGTAHPASAYGAAGSVILILLWASYSTMIMFFGAEFTAAYATLYKTPHPPTAIAITDRK